MKNKEDALQTQDLVQTHEIDGEESEPKPITIVVPISSDSTAWKQSIDRFSELFNGVLPNVDELKCFVQHELSAKINVSSIDLTAWTCYSGDAELMSKLFQPNDVDICTEFKSRVMERILRPVVFDLTTDASAVWPWDSWSAMWSTFCIPRRLRCIAVLELFQLRGAELAQLSAVLVRDKRPARRRSGIQ